MKFSFSKAEANLTAEKLRETFSYDPETGVFTRLKAGGRFMPGETAGCVRNGRVSINIGYDRFFAHRLAWLYMTGEWPIDTVDHIDRDPMNNRWENLRMATHSEQMINQAPRNSKKLLGTSRRTDRTDLWAARIKINKVQTNLGYFKTEQAAHEAYMKAKATMHAISTYPKEARYLCS